LIEGGLRSEWVRARWQKRGFTHACFSVMVRAMRGVSISLDVRSEGARQMLMSPARRSAQGQTGRKRYEPPGQSHVSWLRELLRSVDRRDLSARQLDIFRPVSEASQPDDLRLFWAGDISLLSHPCVSIVGTREASDQGRARAKRLARELTQRRVAIVSGLARGIDTAAQTSAIESGGHTIGVIGTPLTTASPSENAPLQE
jgi:hypothetical protein